MRITVADALLLLPIPSDTAGLALGTDDNCRTLFITACSPHLVETGAASILFEPTEWDIALDQSVLGASRDGLLKLYGEAAQKDELADHGGDAMERVAGETDRKLTRLCMG